MKQSKAETSMSIACQFRISIIWVPGLGFRISGFGFRDSGFGITTSGRSTALRMAAMKQSKAETFTSGAWSILWRERASEPASEGRPGWGGGG